MSPSRRPSKPPPPVARWLPAILAVGALLVVVIVAAVGGGKDSGASASDSPTSATDVSNSGSGAADPATADTGDTSDSGYEVTGLTVPQSTIPSIESESTLPAADKTPLDRNLFMGVYGDDVKAVQTRLTQLGFAPGVADGAFGEMTREAVWAFEKLVLGTPSDSATGKVTNDMWQRMQDPIVIEPRRPGNGTHVEIYLPQQVAAVFTDNKATLVLHISSGAAITPERTPENSWCETIKVDTDANGDPLNPPIDKPVCGVAYTPGGVFRFQRELQGDHVGALGGMYNPVYFNYGIAMHGAQKVPLTPASHGCIRMNLKISNTFQSYVHIHDRVYVWGWDGKEPEQYSRNEKLPVFNFADPTATTTTTTTTTTVKATTTTAKATTTTVKSTTTGTTVKATTTTSTVKTPVTTTTVKSAPTTTAAAPVTTATPTTQAASTPTVVTP